MYKPIHITSVPEAVTRHIRAEMIRAKITNVMVAEKTGKHPSLVSKNLRGLIRTPEIREFICAEIGMTEEELWGFTPENEAKKRASG